MRKSARRKSLRRKFSRRTRRPKRTKRRRTKNTRRKKRKQRGGDDNQGDGGLSLKKLKLFAIQSRGMQLAEMRGLDENALRKRIFGMEDGVVGGEERKLVKAEATAKDEKEAAAAKKAEEEAAAAQKAADAAAKQNAEKGAVGAADKGLTEDELKQYLKKNLGYPQAEIDEMTLEQIRDKVGEMEAGGEEGDGSGEDGKQQQPPRPRMPRPNKRQ